MKEEKLKSRGITLIALIITIIVMLILVAVTVSVALNGGVIGKTQEAKTKTEEAMANEQNIERRIKIDEIWYDSIDDYLVKNQSDNQSDSVNGPWTQNLKEGTVTNGSVTLNIGDYVNYEKYVTETGSKEEEIENLYTELQQYSGFTDYSANAGKNYSENYPIKKDDLKWRILDVKDGQLRLISDKPTETKLYLVGWNGYNNAVYLIDKVCNTLYGTDKGTAQNLKIEDIQNVMDLSTWDYRDYENSLVDTGKYGGKIEITGTYPAIYAKEKTGCVNGTQGTELGLSQQIEPYIQTDEEFSLEQPLLATQTFWGREMNNDNWKNDIYQQIFIKNSSGSNYAKYLMSSRCVQVAYTKSGGPVHFCLNTVHDGSVGCDGFAMSSWGGSYREELFRPVVTLSSDVEIVGNSNSQPHEIK